MKTLLDLIARAPEPAPWSEGDNIPWDDPEFSERMLAEHLSQEHDLASRKSRTIDRHVEWIFAELLGSRPARLLDLGCGPGLYTTRLARLGCECVGIDFSPASIRHAREAVAGEPDPACAYHHADLREAPFGQGFDLVMMLYGQFNVFPRERAAEILGKAHRALKAGGSLLLEYQGPELIQQGGESAPSWYSARSGLFSGSPHLVLQENFWHADARASTTRFLVVDGQTGNVSSYALSNEAYTGQELTEHLQAAGFKAIRRFPSLSGATVDERSDLPVIVGVRSS